jgi:hypothetical protein
MIRAALVDLLPEHPAGLCRDPAGAFDPIWRPAARLASTEPRTAQDLDTSRQAAAFADGFAAGHAEATQSADVRLAAERTAADSGVQQARDAWVADEGERLAALIAGGLADHIAAVRTDIATILDSWVMRALETAAVETVVTRITALTRRAAQPAITIHGRLDLAEAVAAGLARHHITATVEAAAAPGLRVRLGATVITTDDEQMWPGPLRPGRQEAAR